MRKNFDVTGTAGTFTGYVDVEEIIPGRFNINGYANRISVYFRDMKPKEEVIALLADAEHDVMEKLNEISVLPPKEKTFTEKLNELGYI